MTINCPHCGKPIYLVAISNAYEQQTIQQPLLLKQIQEIDWPEQSCRINNALTHQGIRTIYDLVQKTEGELLREPNFGRKSLNAIKSKLKEMDLWLADARYTREL